MYRFAVADKGENEPPGAQRHREEKPRRAPKTGASERIGSDRITAYHEYTRTKGVNWPLYLVARVPPARPS